MDYVSWPEHGCTLAEARERTADRARWVEWRALIDEAKSASQLRRRSQKITKTLDRIVRHQQGVDAHIRELEIGINAEFQLQLADRRLIAYGQVGHRQAPRQLIANEIWPSLAKYDWENSSAGEQPGIVYYSVRVFTALLAPCRADLIAGSTLSEAFRKFVLEDPEVAALAKPALRLAPQFERLFTEGHCYLRGRDEWPVAFERIVTIGVVHPDPHKRSVFDAAREPDSLEVVVAAEALLDRFHRLIGAFRRGEVDALGLPPSLGRSETIPRSVWSHVDFYFNSAGDVFQVNLDCEDPQRDGLTRRWIGVILQRGPTALPAQTATENTRGQVALAGLHSDIGPLNHPPFMVADVHKLGSLSEALLRLVLQHPHVQMLFTNAFSFGKKEGILVEENAGLVALVSGHHEPLLPLRYFGKRDYELNSFNLAPAGEAVDCEAYFGGWPPEIASYYDAISLRAWTLFEMLQKREILARGHTAAGQLVSIAHSIWSHEDYYVHPPTGDIYEGTPGTMTKIWSAVILEGVSFRADELSHVKPPVRDGIPLDTVESVSKKKSLTRIVTSEAAHKECVDWLVEIMRANPDKRNESKASLWAKAHEKWPKALSQRSFFAARTEAIRASGAIIWRAGGAPKKSQH